jgi:hypothetical protein
VKIVLSGSLFADMRSCGEFRTGSGFRHGSYETNAANSRPPPDGCSRFHNELVSVAAGNLLVGTFPVPGDRFLLVRSPEMGVVPHRLRAQPQRMRFGGKTVEQ